LIIGFKQFGLKNFVSETKAEEFVKYLEQGSMMTTRCKKCQKITFPPKMDCITCKVSEMEWIEINEIGKLETFTVVMYSPAGFENETPYTLAVVKFSMGIKIFGQIDKKIPIEEIKVGMEMKVVPCKLLQNRFAYQFERV
jgi:uncharacterized OB-fold protein